MRELPTPEYFEKHIKENKFELDLLLARYKRMFHLVKNAVRSEKWLEYENASFHLEKLAAEIERRLNGG